MKQPFIWLMSILAVLGLAVLLKMVFAGSIVLDPVLIQLGPISVRWYGLIMATAIAVAYLVAERRLVRVKVSQSVIDQLLWWAIASGLVGARLGFVVQNIGYYQQHLSEVVAITHGGLSIHGAVLVGAIAVLILVRRTKLSFLVVADAVAPALLVGAVIGRFGNFTNYELYGYPTMVAWKMFVPLIYRLPGYESFAFFHPTFLYESILNLIMFGSILWLERHQSGSRFTVHGSRSGTIFLLTIAAYSVSRFFVEYFRIGTVIGSGLTLAQWVSLGVILIALIVIIWPSRTVKVR